MSTLKRYEVSLDYDDEAPGDDDYAWLVDAENPRQAVDLYVADCISGAVRCDRHDLHEATGFQVTDLPPLSAQPGTISWAGTKPAVVPASEVAAWCAFAEEMRLEDEDYERRVKALEADEDDPSPDA